MGRFLFDAILQRDYPVIQGINLLVVSVDRVDEPDRRRALCRPRPADQVLADAERDESLEAGAAAGRSAQPGRALRGVGAAGRRCWLFAGASRWAPSGGVIVVAMLRDGRRSRSSIAPYAYDQRIRGRAHEAAERRALAGHRQPQPRHVEPRRLRRPHLGHGGLRDDRPRHRGRRAPIGVSSAYFGGAYDIARAAHRRRLDVVPLPRHHPVASWRCSDRGSCNVILALPLLIAARPGSRVIRGATLSVMQQPLRRGGAGHGLRATPHRRSATSCPT